MAGWEGAVLGARMRGGGCLRGYPEVTLATATIWLVLAAAPAKKNVYWYDHIYNVTKLHINIQL